jgi:hypothetical protein
MPSPTFVKIQTVAVTSASQASIEFTGIPQTYTDLRIIMNGKINSGSAQGSYITFNTTGGTYTGMYIIGDGTTTNSGALAQYVGSAFGTNGSTDAHSITIIELGGYTTSNPKPWQVENYAPNFATSSANYRNIISGNWSGTGAITSIALTTTGNWVQKSEATLYGIKNS